MESKISQDNRSHRTNGPGSPSDPAGGISRLESAREFWSQPGWRGQPRWRWALLIAIVGGLLVFRALHRGHSNAGKNRGALAVPVAATPARLGDMPVYLDGLGTVTAYYSVTVRSRVDGQLMSVPVREGQYVHAGDLLAEIDPRPFQAALDQAQGQLAKDQSNLQNARVDLERYKNLIAQQAIPQQQLDTQVATVGQLQGTVQSDQAAVEAAKLNLTYAHITSPISGRVGLRLVDPGNMIHATDANGLLVIAQLQPITVIFTLPEDAIPRVMQKWRAGPNLPVDAYNRDKTQKLASGRLLTVDNQIDPNTGTLKLKAVFENEENTLFPNQFVNARLLLETEHNQTIVPSVAVQRGSQGTFVYVVSSSNTAVMRPVTLGPIEGNDASITGGLQAGDNVVTDGADKIQPGSPVTIPKADEPATPPAAAPAGKHQKRPKA
ncbi:MAG TPA: MdtA/MuxA family multidrug efflux RND transporter periplasmic adaptor subunit [Elusimicrobiota bacterium]|nr:MdtA/MuxA family multidrug efflux RND transporter periplasmic adaptor subunit [Elusimicrobiota bacterium]